MYILNCDTMLILDCIHIFEKLKRGKNTEYE